MALERSRNGYGGTDLDEIADYIIDCRIPDTPMYCLVVCDSSGFWVSDPQPSISHVQAADGAIQDIIICDQSRGDITDKLRCMRGV